MPTWVLVILTASLSFIATELYIHDKIIMLMQERINIYQAALEEKEEELAAKRVEFAEVWKEKNKWIMECVRLKNKLAGMNSK